MIASASFGPECFSIQEDASSPAWAFSAWITAGHADPDFVTAAGKLILQSASGLGWTASPRSFLQPIAELCLAMRRRCMVAYGGAVISENRVRLITVGTRYSIRRTGEWLACQPRSNKHAGLRGIEVIGIDGRQSIEIGEAVRCDVIVPLQAGQRLFLTDYLNYAEDKVGDDVDDWLNRVGFETPPIAAGEPLLAGRSGSIIQIG